MNGGRRAVLIFACLVVFAAGRSAQAQSESRFDWTGFHVGVNLGLDWLSGTRSITQTLSSGSLSLSRQVATNNGNGIGVLFGGQLGYDVQLNSFLIGVETDFQGSSVSGIATGTGIIGSASSSITDRANLNWLGTTRLRLGYATDTFVPYITGGLAYGGVQMNTTATTALGGASLLQSASKSATLLGFAVGGGLDYAIDKAWAVRLEALYYDLGTLSLTAPGTSSPPGVTGVLNSSNHFSGGLVRIGINLHL